MGSRRSLQRLPGHLVSRVLGFTCPFGDEWPAARDAWRRWRELRDAAAALDSQAGHARHAARAATSAEALAAAVATLEALAPRQREASQAAAGAQQRLLRIVFLTPAPTTEEPDHAPNE